MEIKPIKKIERKEYPNLNEINQNKLKYRIPKRWLNFGITTFLFDIVIKSKVFAITPNEIIVDDIQVATGGIVAEYQPIYNLARVGCSIVSIISAIALFISFVNILHIKAKAKTENKKMDINKKTKIICIISIVLLSLSIIGRLIINYLD